MDTRVDYRKIKRQRFTWFSVIVAIFFIGLATVASGIIWGLRWIIARVF